MRGRVSFAYNASRNSRGVVRGHPTISIAQVTITTALNKLVLIMDGLGLSPPPERPVRSDPAPRRATRWLRFWPLPVIPFIPRVFSFIRSFVLSFIARSSSHSSPYARAHTHRNDHEGLQVWPSPSFPSLSSPFVSIRLASRPSLPSRPERSEIKAKPVYWVYRFGLPSPPLALLPSPPFAPSPLLPSRARVRRHHAA